MANNFFQNTEQKIVFNKFKGCSFARTHSIDFYNFPYISMPVNLTG